MHNRIKRTKLSTGTDVQIFLLPAGEGLKTATKLFKTFAPTLGTVVSSVQETGEVDYMSAAFTISENLDKIDINELVAHLLNGMAINGQDVNFDDYFVQKYDELVEIISFALKENFGSFLKLNGFVEKYLPMLKRESSETVQSDM